MYTNKPNSPFLHKKHRDSQIFNSNEKGIHKPKRIKSKKNDQSMFQSKRKNNKLINKIFQNQIIYPYLVIINQGYLLN